MNFDRYATVLFLSLATVADVGRLVMSVGRVWGGMGRGHGVERGIICYELEIKDTVKKVAFLGHTRSLP